MSVLKYLLWTVLLAHFITFVSSEEIASLNVDSISIHVDRIENGLNLTLERYGRRESVGIIGRSVNTSVSETMIVGNTVYLVFKSGQCLLSLERTPFGHTLNVSWSGELANRYEDCFDLGDHQWYGGPQQKRQYWPIQKLTLSEYSYVTKEADNAAVVEPYWLSSDGTFIYVKESVPLFVDQNNIAKNHVCFISQIKPPYSSKRPRNDLYYVFGIYADALSAHMYAVNYILGKPSGIPDRLMTEHPIWSTWAKYKTQINETTVLDFASNIRNHAFENSQLEIDDLWETCYGSFNVDTNKYPDLRNLSRRLKAEGFRVTMWIHPFINNDCDPWYSEALDKGYFVKNENGSVATSWWNSVGATSAYVDFTNSEARTWWYNRLKDLQKKYEIDSFKFDAGESSWSPQIPIQRGNVYENPSLIATRYIETCARFGPIVEVRTGERTQRLPIYLRMIDKDSEWTFENGLPTLVTTLLQMNMNGYPFVLPDMIGGNGYNGAPSKELFIRWLQANTFMPSLQFSYVPWDYDNQTIAICKIYALLHSIVTPYIISTFQKSVSIGVPANPPIWWIDPHNPVAQTIWDEYLLGDELLVAPVLVEGATSRDVYLPLGQWIDAQSGETIRGQQWLRNYSAPIEVLPFFVRSSMRSDIKNLLINVKKRVINK